jgi:hypothetical protein
MQAQEVLATQAQDGSDAALLQGMPARLEAVASDALLDANSIETDGTEPQLDDAVGGPCLDLVMLCSGPSVPECIAPSDAVPAPEFSGAMDPGVAGLGLLGSPGSLLLHVNCKQVEDSVEQTCSQVAATDMLLWGALAMVGRDILDPI